MNFKSKGNIALTTVIIIMGVLLTTVLGLAISSVDVASSLSSYSKSQQLAAYMDSCLEVVKLKTLDLESYPVNIDMSMQSATCSAVINKNAATYTAEVTVSYGSNRLVKLVDYNR